MPNPRQLTQCLDHQHLEERTKTNHAFDGIADAGNQPDDPGDLEAAAGDGRDTGCCADGSVWLVGQRSAAAQRRGRYIPESAAHPARMWPEIARQAVVRYSRPGDLVADPMCGIGTTLVEAIHAGRDAIGIEYEQRWTDLTRANLDLACALGATGTGLVVPGDATGLPAVLPSAVRGRVDLVVTSPPRGRTMRRQVEHRCSPLTRHHNTHGSHGELDPANLAHRGRVDLIEGITQVLAGCANLLRPGGIAVITARPWRCDGLLVDLPGAVMAAGQASGLEPVQRCVALLAGIRGDQLLPRHSFFQLTATRESRRKGIPIHLQTHEDVLVLRRPLNRIGSPEPRLVHTKTESTSSRGSCAWQEVRR
jgi:modification methylase